MSDSAAYFCFFLLSITQNTQIHKPVTSCLLANVVDKGVSNIPVFLSASYLQDKALPLAPDSHVYELCA